MYIRIELNNNGKFQKLMELNNMEEKNISELLRAKAHIWNQTFNFINSMSLKCAVELGIPDIIHGHAQPMTLSQLVMALQINPSKASKVRRLMRILVHSGFFTLQKLVGDEEGYELTEATRLLLKDSPFNERPIVLMVLDRVMLKPWELVSTWFKNDDVGTFTAPFDVAHGEMVWNFAAHEPRFNVLFNEAMASDGPLVSCVLRSKCREAFEGLSSLVDVGGGTGNLAKSLAETFPHLKCTVLDLPHVVADLQGSNNLHYLGGDMLESIPPADAILLKWILHDWNDEDCVKILKNCKDAIMGEKGQVGKVIIIDIVMGCEDWEEKKTETQLFFDMEMMVVAPDGRERSEEEWAKLFIDAGFSNYKIYPVLGLRALVEVYP